ncbi:hypothetical protein SDC9_116128 [bioreactor metagenome]|uniref:Uncharacterized protein n=1 Tax=bioreactor metagenome TaxID=1076179 RepID=A0A645C5F7_9ZZZZ
MTKTKITSASTNSISAGSLLRGALFDELSIGASQNKLEKYQPEQHGVEGKKGGINNPDKGQSAIFMQNEFSGYECQDDTANKAEQPVGIVSTDDRNGGREVASC